MGWRDVAMVRALGRYLRQIRVSFGQDYLASTLARHDAIAAKIVALFYVRFDPGAGDGCARAKPASAPRSRSFSTAVTSLDDDRILRRFVNLVEAAVRTNFFQIDSDGLARRRSPSSSKPPGRGPAAAETALRDLRLLATGRGRAPALRQSGARGPALVGPAAGFPHRDLGLVKAQQSRMP